MKGPLVAYFYAELLVSCVVGAIFAAIVVVLLIKYMF